MATEAPRPTPQSGEAPTATQHTATYGQQPFQTYQPYGAAAPPMGTPRWSTLQQEVPAGAQVIEPPPVLETKAWIMTKMSLHGVGFIFAIVVLALGLTFLNDEYWGLLVVNSGIVNIRLSSPLVCCVLGLTELN